MKLNKRQLQAVNFKNGPLLIIAGAGTGKTTVITERIKSLVARKKAKPDQILALTFTEKAAGEMSERLDEVMPLGYEEPWVLTFHAFCDRILKEESLEIGLSPDYKILDKAGSWLLFKKHLFDFNFQYYLPLSNPTKFIDAILKFISRAQDEDVSVQDFLTYVKKSGRSSKLEEVKKLKELTTAYQKYQEIKLKENALDFGDLISFSLKLFRTRVSILKKYQNQFKYVLVDEFQDTNISQLELIKLLCPPGQKKNLTVVGDDFQAIYKWRGAAVSNILDFKKHYPEAKTIILNSNYRSSQSLLDRTYQLIKNNEPETLEVKLGLNKQLIATRKLKTKPEIVILQNLESEADFVVKKIHELSAKKNYTYTSFAILARANNHLDPFVLALKRNGIPYQLLGNRGLFDQEEIKSLMAFLRVVVDPEDSLFLHQLMLSDIFKIRPALVFNLLGEARKKRESLWLVIKACKDDHIQKLIMEIETSQKKASKKLVSQILYEFIQNISFVKPFLKEENLENQLKLKNLNLFFELIKKYEREVKTPGLVDFVDFLDLLLEAGENPGQAEIEDIDTVKLLTVHSSKGLEFPVVFMVNLTSDRFPTRKKGDPIEFPEALVKETLAETDRHLQEERRLFYVGCTRARDYLFLSLGLDYGGKRLKKPSGFLKELGLTIKKAPLAKKTPPFFLVEKEITPKPALLKKEYSLSYISYSQIATYQACPLQYKYRYLLHIPEKAKASLSFGQTIHRVLYDFHRFEQKGKRLGLDELNFLYKQHFISEGYGSREHRKLRFKEGKKILQKYFKVYPQNFQQPLFLEKSFRLKINGVPLFGKIDRIDKVGDTFELIDYKTGSPKDQKAVDQDIQLTIYNIASQEALRIEPESLALYFIENNKKVTTQRSAKQIKKVKEKIQAVIEEIRNGDFKARPGHPFPCGFCSYNLICPFARRA